MARAVEPVTPATLGLSPRATLIVRRVTLRTPLPRNGSVDEFGTSLRDELRARIVTARRGRTTSADADLLFEDDAALEAAIVADWLDRSPGASRPWWVPVVGATPPPERWRRGVFRDARSLPRILSRLVETGHAVPWLARFEPSELAVAAQHLLNGFGVRMPTGLPPVLAEHQAGPNAVPAAIKPTATQDVTRTIAPEAFAFAGPEARVLIAVALAIVRRPAVVSTPVFAAALATISHTSGEVVVPPRTGPGDKAEPPPLSSNALSLEIPGRKRVSRSGRVNVSASVPAMATARTRNLPAAGPAIQRRVMQSSVAVLGPELVAATDPVEPSTLAVPIQTEFGGLLFLLNAFVALGLFGDATRPADGLKGLSPFELLVLLGDRWFGVEFRDDPLRATLIRLSGLRPHDRPGCDFDAPLWSVPDDWLRPWPAAAPVTRGKVRWHPAGFSLDAGPATLRTRAALRRRWIERFARYLDARLQQALGDDAAVALTCRIPAELTCDGDRVEARFVLDRHPIALRLAGLDRDPGWMPMAGHSIGFVFA